MDNQKGQSDRIFEDFHLHYKNKEYEACKEIMHHAIDEALPQIQDTDEIEYHDFHNAMESMLFDYHFEPSKEVRIIDTPISQYYSLYGSVLIDEGKLDEARGYFSKALFWNPTNFSIFSEYMETFKIGRDMESFARLSKMSLKYAVSSAMVARVMRNLGYYFIEKEDYAPAIACYQRSLVFEDNENVMKELEYIQTKSDEKVEPFSADKIRELSRKYDFPLGADKDVVGLSRYLGEYHLKEGNTEAAEYYYSVAYDLTDDEAVKEILQKLQGSEGAGKNGQKEDQ